LKYSIVVPTYNEEHDIEKTLLSLIAIEWPDYEIIVVDDSTDNTPNIVHRYEQKGVKLIRPAKREGRCGARNLGIIEAKGEVVVILNADTHLPKNFFQLLSPHYENGADYVLVSSVVENMEDLFARYVECAGKVMFYNRDEKFIEWTEGFSCRRNLAIKAGLFPTGFAVPICAGEDGFFGTNLRALGAKKKVDLSIVVTHVAPASFAEYWYIRKGRGQGSPQVRRFLEKWSYSQIRTRACLRVIKNILMLLTLLPMISVCYQYAKQSERGLKDVIPFCWAWIIEQASFSVGEFESLNKIIKAEEKLTGVKA